MLCWAPTALAAAHRQPMSATQLSRENANACAICRLLRSTASACSTTLRTPAAPWSAGLCRRALIQARIDRTDPSILSGWRAAHWTTTTIATRPNAESTSRNGLDTDPTRKKPSRASSTMPTVDRTPEITSCHDATTRVAPHCRVLRYVRVVPKTCPPGMQVEKALAENTRPTLAQ